MIDKKEKTFISADVLEKQKEYTKKVTELNEQYSDETGRQRLALVYSFGCQQNVADGERLAGQLSEMGYGFTKRREEADLILFNTCAVREHAETKVFGNVGELKRLKEKNPSMIIGLCGCMTQQEAIVEKLKKSYPFVDLIFGTGAIHRLPEFVNSRLNGGGKIADLTDAPNSIAEGLPVRRTDPFKAWISVMYGCNNFCTYCIVPYVRGRERSRASEEILKEITELVKDGCKEFTLLGQNVNSYGKDREEELDFPALLRAINEIPGEFRIRFMTPHPKDATEELLNTMADCEKIAKHIHLPVQSGSNAVLKKMNRGYTKEHYLETVRTAREKMPEITFTSDILLGFPGETETDFEETLELIKEVRYNALYTFIYSKRSGTPAATMEDPTPYALKAERMGKLLEVQDAIGRAVAREAIGTPQRVLIEEKRPDGLLYGKNDSMLSFVMEGSGSLVGHFVTAIPESLTSWTYTSSIKKV